MNKRKTSIDEKRQKAGLKSILKEISAAKGLMLNLSEWENVSRSKKRSEYVAEDGNIYKHEYRKRKFYDSRRLDAKATFTDGKRDLTIYWFLKWTDGKGGAQDMIQFEVGRTLECMKRNRKRNVYFTFLLEGNYWDNSVLDEIKNKSKNIFITNNINSIRENLISKLNTYFKI